jgi:LysR family transcriptional activator of nhaA
VISKEIAVQYKVRLVGQIPGVQERFYAVTLSRRIKHPGVIAISDAAKSLVFAHESGA